MRLYQIFCSQRDDLCLNRVVCAFFANGLNRAAMAALLYFELG